jgi:hypothetical protein
MIKDIFLKNNTNFYKGEAFIPPFTHIKIDRKEIFNKDSLNCKPCNYENSEILSFLLKSDFKYIYYSTTIIDGENCICLILDENLCKCPFFRTGLDSTFQV